jgi:hypothetical protein
MSASRSVQLYAAWLEGTTKLDYYILGIVLALVGYWGKDLHPLEIASGRQVAEVLGLLLLLLSGYLGVRRIETTLVLLQLNQRRLHQQERPSADVERAQRLLSKFDAAFNKQGRKAVGQYKWRNKLLFAGVLLVLASRLWPQ